MCPGQSRTSRTVSRVTSDIRHQTSEKSKTPYSPFFVHVNRSFPVLRPPKSSGYLAQASHETPGLAQSRPGFCQVGLGRTANGTQSAFHGWNY